MDNAKKLISLIPCKICGDKCSGKHYGVCSCEGCKSFFRRSLLKNVRYECQHKNFCQSKITRATRNKCQACRFKKCVAAGMGREGVKLGRMTKTAQEKMTQEVHAVLGESQSDKSDTSPSAPSDGSGPASPPSKVLIEGLPYTNEGEIEQNVISAHMKTCTYTTDEIKAMALSYNPKLPISHRLNFDKVFLLNLCTRKVGVAIKHIIEFAKDIRAFAEFPSHQILFLKSATLELLVIRLSRVLDVGNSAALFGDQFVPISTFAELGCSSLLDKISEVACFLASLRLTEEEIALLSCAMLINDHGSLKPQQCLKAFRGVVLKVLEQHLSNSHSENSTAMLDNIFSQIESVSRLRPSHLEFMETAEKEWEGVEVDPLYRETLIEDFNEEKDMDDDFTVTSSPRNTVAPDNQEQCPPGNNASEVFYFQNENNFSPSSFTSTSTSGPALSPGVDGPNGRLQNPNIFLFRPATTNRDMTLNNQLANFSIGSSDPYLPDLGDVADLLPTPPVDVSSTSFCYAPVPPNQLRPPDQSNEGVFNYYC